MLNTLPKIKLHDGKRVGRGYASGKGSHTTGRGTKGHKSRSGYSNPRPGFEGGSMPLSRRLPKLKGFSRRFFRTEKTNATVTTSALNFFDNDSVVDIKALKEKNIIANSVSSVKVVLKGDLQKKLQFKNIAFSKSAKEAVEKGGSKIN